MAKRFYARARNAGKAFTLAENFLDMVAVGGMAARATDGGQNPIHFFRGGVLATQARADAKTPIQKN